MSTLLVFTNLPERAAAERLADVLLEKKLAACVNILAPCRSASARRRARAVCGFSVRVSATRSPPQSPYTPLVLR